ncbi:MAG: hypothetical protein P8J50_09735 [Acidimicrobiales bacterium]|nr:hypothetical protein [Acidimicrobiales bacterium]
MAAPSLAAAPKRSTAPRKAAAAQPRLRVVRHDERVRTVGTISTMVAAFFFVVMLALAGLHAIVVQTQADLDGVNDQIADLETGRVHALAELAWAESAAGLSEVAAAAGYVPAADHEHLALVAPAALEAPVTVDPFRPGSAALPEPTEPAPVELEVGAR